MQKVFYNSKEEKCRIVGSSSDKLAAFCVVENPKFCIDEKLRKIYLESGILNNHAFAFGKVLMTGDAPPEIGDGFKEAAYSKERGFFYLTKTSAPLTDARLAVIAGKRIFVRF